MSAKNNLKARKFMLLLYPDNEQHIEILEKIKQTYEYIYILHDKDIMDDGTTKKAHWHVIISFRNAKWKSAVVKELQIEERLIEHVKSEESALQYLIHYNEETKHHYSIEEVQGTKVLVNKLISSIQKNSLSESEKVGAIIEMIFSSGYMTVRELTLEIIEKGYFDVYRRSLSLFMKLLDENNSYYKN